LTLIPVAIHCAKTLKIPAGCYAGLQGGDSDSFSKLRRGWPLGEKSNQLPAVRQRGSEWICDFFHKIHPFVWYWLAPMAHADVRPSGSPPSYQRGSPASNQT
jgi:hypothetical protein